jgi:hypothetical protein
MGSSVERSGVGARGILWKGQSYWDGRWRGENKEGLFVPPCIISPSIASFSFMAPLIDSPSLFFSTLFITVLPPIFLYYPSLNNPSLSHPSLFSWPAFSPHLSSFFHYPFIIPLIYYLFLIAFL